MANDVNSKDCVVRDDKIKAFMSKVRNFNNNFNFTPTPHPHS